MTQKIEKSLSEINNRIAKIDEKQDTLRAYILELVKHHVMETFDSLLKHAQARLSYIIALLGLGIALYALGVVFVDIVAHWVFTVIGIGLLVYAFIELTRLERLIRTIKGLKKETEDILSSISKEIKKYLTSENEK